MVNSVMSHDAKFTECCICKQAVNEWLHPWSLGSLQFHLHPQQLWRHHKLLQTGNNYVFKARESLRDGRDAAGPFHDETHLHVREAVLFGLGAALVCCSHMQIEAQRHRLLPQFGVTSEEGALPLLYHLVNLLCPVSRLWQEKVIQ